MPWRPIGALPSLAGEVSANLSELMGWAKLQALARAIAGNQKAGTPVGRFRRQVFPLACAAGNGKTHTPRDQCIRARLAPLRRLSRRQVRMRRHHS